MGSFVEGEINRELSNPFDCQEAKRNDTVAGMKIISIDYGSYYKNICGANVEFSSKVAITGTYEHWSKDEYFGDCVVFYPDENSKNKLPKMISDNRIIWFTFTNYKEAVQAFGSKGSEGIATIVINNYHIIWYETEVSNTAKLVEVLQ